jgi:hypothetical protein
VEADPLNEPYCSTTDPHLIPQADLSLLLYDPNLSTNKYFGEYLEKAKRYI